MEKTSESYLAENSKNVKKQTIHPIAELISTEVDYLVQLHNIVNGYLREYRDKNSKISRPRNLEQVQGLLVFSNIEKIFEWHRDHFLKCLVLNQHNPSKLAQVFIDNEPKFQMYATYCKHKKMGKYVIVKYLKYYEKLQKHLDQKEELHSLLIRPVQRLANYKVLIAEIIKHVKKAGMYDELPRLYEAESIIAAIGNYVNEFTALEDFEDYLPNHGKLLHHGDLTCDYKKKKNIKLYAFIFKQSVVFTHKTESATKFGNNSYKIFLKIPMNKIELYELPENKFFLCSSAEVCEEFNIICTAPSADTYQKWLQVIKRQLSLQYKLMMSLVEPTDNGDMLTAPEKPREMLI